jgi:polyhydroxyalkanoate synthase
MVEKSEKAIANILKETALFQQRIVNGFEHLLEVKDIDVASTPKELVFQQDKVQLFHYRPEKTSCGISVVVVYALVNRQYMMDLQEDRSLIRNLLKEGVDLYVVDWGYPSKPDKYLTMEDYILGYMDECVNFVSRRNGSHQVNLMGICQGGTMATIYASLFPEKIRNLVLMVAPIDFHTEDGLLNIWAKAMDVDLMVDVMGNIPGDFMNLGFLWLKPFQLLLDKYVGLLDNADDDQVIKNFLRMERWIFDSPDQAGEMFRKFVKDLYQENKLVKGQFELGGRRVNLKNLTMPVLNIYGEQDHLVPPSCSTPLKKLAGSKDVTNLNYPVGHIGMYVSGKTQRELAPTVAQWLGERCSGYRPIAEEKRGAEQKRPAEAAETGQCTMESAQPQRPAIASGASGETPVVEPKKKKPSSRRAKIENS